jgi:hypothetical protein
LETLTAVSIACLTTSARSAAVVLSK